MILQFFNRVTYGAAIAWGIWTPRVAFAFGILWWLCGYEWLVVPLGMVTCTWVAIRFDRPIQHDLKRAWEASQTKEAIRA